jgi:hypothetical protein
MKRDRRIHDALWSGEYSALNDVDLFDLCEDFPCSDAKREWKRWTEINAEDCVNENSPEDSPSAPMTRAECA